MPACIPIVNTVLAGAPATSAAPPPEQPLSVDTPISIDTPNITVDDTTYVP